MDKNRGGLLCDEWHEATKMTAKVAKLEPCQADPRIETTVEIVAVSMKPLTMSWDLGHSAKQ